MRFSVPFLVPIQRRDANHIRRFSGVSRIQNTAKFVIAAQKRIRFVNQQSRLRLFNDAKESRRTDIGRNNRATDEFAQHTKQSSFAAAFLGRFDADVRADVAEMERIGMNGPEGERFGGPLWKDDETFDYLGQGIEQGRAIDGFGPRLDLSEFEQEVGWSICISLHMFVFMLFILFRTLTAAIISS
jgi:hypothetical protein